MKPVEYFRYFTAKDYLPKKPVMNLDHFITLRSSDCLELFPSNHSANFRNTIYKRISLDPPSSFEIGMTEITFQAPATKIEPLPPKPLPPIPIPKFFETPSDGNIDLTWITKDQWNVSRGQTVSLEKLIKQLNDVLQKSKINVTFSFSIVSPPDILNARIDINDPQGRELYLSPSLAQVLGFNSVHFPSSGTFLGDLDVRDDDLKDLAPETVFSVNLGIREPFVVTVEEPESYTLSSLLNSMGAAFKTVPGLKIGTAEYEENLMLRFVIFTESVQFKFLPAYLNYLTFQ